MPFDPSRTLYLVTFPDFNIENLDDFRPDQYLGVLEEDGLEFQDIDPFTEALVFPFFFVAKKDIVGPKLEALITPDAVSQGFVTYHSIDFPSVVASGYVVQTVNTNGSVNALTGYRGALSGGDDFIERSALSRDFKLNLKAGDDVVLTGPGNDTLLGRVGDDALNGNDGNDKLRGHGGDDSLYGGNGRDKLFGGNGQDLLIGGEGKDKLNGNKGADELFGEDGNDKLLGGAHADLLEGGNGNDVLKGGGGADVLEGGDGRDRLFGNGGDDELRGGNGKDSLFGGDGSDRLYGGSGPNRLSGGRGEDYLYGASGGDTVDTFVFVAGESGFDHVEGFDIGTDIIEIDLKGASRSTVEFEPIQNFFEFGTIVRYGVQGDYFQTGSILTEDNTTLVFV